MAARDNGLHNFLVSTEEHLAQEGLARILVAERLSDEALASVKNRVERMQEETSCEPTGLKLLAGLVLALPDMSHRAASWLRRGLVSANPEVAREALRALVIWIDTTRTKPDAIKPPDDLTEEVSGMLIARRPGTVEAALEFACWLFEYGPEHLRRQIASRCGLALSYILEESDYRNEVLTGYKADLDVPLLRQQGMLLAKAMQCSGWGQEAGVQLWISRGKSDPMFEVRNIAEGLAETG